MNWEDSTIEDIIESEREMVLTGAKRYGAYYENAIGFMNLLGSFIKSVDPDRFIFAAFLSQIRKHSMLALLSALRLHQVEAQMNLRQVIEAGAAAAYAIANPDTKDFATVDKDGFLNPSQELAKKRYDWLDKNFPTGSKSLHNLKKLINNSTSHSNIVYAHKNFKFDPNLGRFETPFFDFEDEVHVKTDLWAIANIIMGVTDLLYGVNKKLEVIKFDPSFVHQLKKLENDNKRLKIEMMANPRLKDKLK